MQLLKFLCAALLVAVAGTAYAYKVTTHAELTSQAWDKYFSAGENSRIYFRLGLGSPNLLLGESYFDLKQDVHLKNRNLSRYEVEIIRERLKYIQPNFAQTPKGYLMVGVIREDDFPEFWKDENVAKVPGDPHYPGDFHREFNHFFDPVNNSPLTAFGSAGINTVYGTGTPVRVAPRWALGTAGFPSSEKGSDTLNHFTLFDVREYMWRALTGKRHSDGEPATEDGTVATEAVRMKYWASTFRALGDVLHLNEDMAQPQHTRNEAHSGKVDEWAYKPRWLQTVLGAGSRYEVFAAENTAKGLVGITQNQYSIPKFPNFSDYWSTAVGQASEGGMGLADFSNHEFFTNGRNFGNTSYVSPPSNESHYELVSEIISREGVESQVSYLKRQPRDFVVPNAFGPARQTLRSELVPTGYSYTMDDNVYTDMLNQLAPRAVGYAAGIINHLFRGQLSIKAPHTGVYGILDHASQYNATTQTDPNSKTQGFKKIRALVENISENANDVMGPMGPTGPGTLTAVLRFRRNLAYKDDLSKDANAPTNPPDLNRNPNEEVAVSTKTYSVTYNANGTVALGDVGALAKNQPQEFEFQFGGGPNDLVLPINASDVYLQVVYRGPLGSGDDTDAVVVATKDLSEPTYENFYNGSRYIRLGNSVYLRDGDNNHPGVNGNPALVGQISPSFNCVEPDGAHLKSHCFQTANMTAVFDHNDPGISHPLVRINNLQPDEFSQVVVLVDSALAASDGSISDPGGTTIADIILFAGSSNPCVSERNPDTWKGASLGHQWVPDSSIPSPYSNPIDATVNSPTLKSVRGVLSTHSTSCVWNGDGGSTIPDNRDEVMLPLTPIAYPQPVTLGFQ